MQHEITTRHPLLDKNGKLTETGYAKSLILDYDRKAIKGGALRIKEWDYYYIGGDDFGVALTIADNSYMGLDSISLLDFRTGWQHTNSPMSVMTLGKLGFPATSAKGDESHGNKKYNIDARLRGGERGIIMSGEYDSVFPMDILPEFLVKAVIAFDIDKMENLGIYEVAPEDFALCEFVDTSKLPLQQIIRNGLDALMKEMN